MNYPPPLLLNFRSSEEDRRPGGILQNTRDILQSKRVEYEDLVLIVDEGTWFQLPAELLIHRFFHRMEIADHELLMKYGRIKKNPQTLPHQVRQNTSQRPSSQCTRNAQNQATSQHATTPRNSLCQNPHTVLFSFIGRILSPIRLATWILHSSWVQPPIFLQYTSKNTRHVTQQLPFPETYLEKILSTSSSWHRWLSSRLDNGVASIVEPGKEYKFGIERDYEGSLFHIGQDDIEFIIFNDHQPLSCGRPNLPLDLNCTIPPFPLREVDPLYDNIRWQDFPSPPTS